MTRHTEVSTFPVSLFVTPHSAHQNVFYTTPRAGHLVAGPEHHVARDHFPGHELILCLEGRGWVRVEGRTHAVAKGDLVWINCHRPHEHGATPNEPWEVYWIRAEGPHLEQISELLGVSGNPVFSGVELAQASEVYREIFRLAGSDAPEAPALIHAAVARLLALAFCARSQPASAAPAVPAALARPVEKMKLFYFEKHRVADLARLAGMSVTHFARLFKAAFGASPIDWLRRERINQAKRRLAGTDASIKEIAEQVGYHDRYFFSKDFKRLTGWSPREFRRREAKTARTREAP